MSLATRINLLKQSRQGVEERKVLTYEDGYTIEQPKDLITKEYVDPALEMIDLLSELIPKPALSLDGQPLSIYNNTTIRFTGYLSADTSSNFKPTQLAGSLVTYIINDGTFDLELTNSSTCMNYGDVGTLELYVNNVLRDSFELGANFINAERAGVQSWTPKSSAYSKIEVTYVGKYNNFSANQRANVILHLNNSDLRKGYNFIELRHINLPEANQISEKFEVFYDTSVNNPTLSPPTLTVASNTNPKWLSGIRFLGLNDTINISMTGNHIYANTFVDTPVAITNIPASSNVNIAYNDSNLIGLSNPPSMNSPFNLVNKTITLNVANKCTVSPLITCTPKDVFGSYTPVTNNPLKMLISTFADTSTFTNEYFDTEKYRLPLTHDLNLLTAPINTWDSTLPLTNGNAQQYVIVENDHGLVYPSIDFTSYLPIQSASYAGFFGDQKYLRAFVSPTSKSNIQIILEGVTAGIGTVGTGAVNVQIKLPTQTALLDAAKPYDSTVGVLQNGNGALTGAISYVGGNAIINITFGGRVTYDSSMLLYVLITLRNNTQTIKSIKTNW